MKQDRIELDKSEYKEYQSKLGHKKQYVSHRK